MGLHNGERGEIDRDTAYLYGAALRYQLPRKTYGSAIVANVIRREMRRLPSETLRNMETDLDEALRDGHAGQECDEREWRDLLLHVSREISQRVLRANGQEAGDVQ